MLASTTAEEEEEEEEGAPPPSVLSAIPPNGDSLGEQQLTPVALGRWRRRRRLPLSSFFYLCFFSIHSPNASAPMSPQSDSPKEISERRGEDAREYSPYGEKRNNMM